MPHAFSVEIHNYLSNKILLAETNSQTAISTKDKGAQLYWKGQLFELTAMRQYLTDKIDLKNQTYY